MAGFYGSSTELNYGTKFPNDARMEIAMDKVIHLINPSRNPFLVLANIIGKEQIPQPKFEWMEDENFISRHFSGTVVTGTDNGADDFGAMLQLTDPRDWQAIEAVPNESGYTHARDIWIKITDGTDYVVGYIEKSAISDGKTQRAMTDGAGTALTETTSFLNAIQITKDASADVVQTATGVDMTIKATSESDESWPTAWGAGTSDAVSVYVYTPNFVASATDGEQGFSYGGFKEGSGTIPDTRKTVSNYHNFVQIFKTSLQVTGTMLANMALYGGPERARLRARKAMQHASDLEWAALFNAGGTEGTDWGVMDATENPRRIFKGFGIGSASSAASGWINTYNGGYNTDMQLSYASGEYNDVVAITEKLFDDTDSGSETKMVYGSKKWLTKFSELFFRTNSGMALNVMNTNLGSEATSAGLRVSGIRTPHGDLIIASHPFLRGPYEDYAMVVDPKNAKLCAYRDTKLRTNIQTPDLDGVMDEYLTEIGLKVMHEHTHAILKLT